MHGRHVRGVIMARHQSLFYQSVTGRWHICHFQIDTLCGIPLVGRETQWRSWSRLDRSMICKRCLRIFRRLNPHLGL